VRHAVFATLVLVAGCATPYQKMGFGGGYDDFRVTENEFEITFRGNGHTAQEQVSRYVLRRASEVTLQNGYTHFEPMAEQDRTRVGYYHASHGTAYAPRGTRTVYGSSSGYSKPIVKPAKAVRIRCYKPPLPQVEGLVDAEAFLRYNYPEALVQRESGAASSRPAKE